MYSIVSNTDFVEWLQQKMKDKGWNQADLAKEAGVSRGSIGNILRQERDPGPALASAIADAFDLPVEFVFRKAGLLPEKPDEPEGLAEWIHRYLTASEEERHQLLEYARFISRNKGE